MKFSNLLEKTECIGGPMHDNRASTQTQMLRKRIELCAGRYFSYNNLIKVLRVPISITVKFAFFVRRLRVFLIIAGQWVQKKTYDGNGVSNTYWKDELLVVHSMKSRTRFFVSPCTHNSSMLQYKWTRVLCGSMR